MHKLLVQCLIARIDRDFSPEEYKALLDEADKELGYAGMEDFYTLQRHISEQYKVLNAKVQRTPTQKKPRHRDIVKQILGESSSVPPGTSFVDQNGALVQQGATYTPEEYEKLCPPPPMYTPEEEEVRPIRAKMDFS